MIQLPLEKMKRIFDKIRDSYNEKGGFGELLKISYPLVLSASTTTVQHFVDRLFLSWYSPQAIASAMTAGLLQYTLLSIFIGSASYTSTFVAQYYGANQKDGIGKSVWQGIYISFISYFFILLTNPFAEDIFSFFGHDPSVVALEKDYYQILCLGSFFAVSSSALSGYFSGQGVTFPVLIGNLIATIVNLLLDFVLIFGKFGFPRMGIRGAAIATNISFFSIFLFYIFLISQNKYKNSAPFFNKWHFDKELFFRFLKFGFPVGIQFFIEMAGYSLFLLIVGKIGIDALTSTTIAFNINNFAFMPMLGISLAVSVMVGQSIGRGEPSIGEKATYNGLKISLTYIIVVCSFYIFCPSFFLRLFHLDENADLKVIGENVVVLLRYVSFYSLFDTLNLTFSGALRGSSDTRFITNVILILSTFVLIIPTSVSVIFFNGNIFTAWIFLTLQVCLLGIVFYLRFKKGKWKKMKVISS